MNDEPANTAEEVCPNFAENKQNCPCKSEDCPRKGWCCKCVAHHRASGGRTACMK